MRSANKGERRGDHRAAALAWAPRMELDRAPLLSDASIRNFTTGYVADAMEHSLLLPKDMADLRSIRQHEVFLGLKRDLAMVSLFFFFYCTSLPFRAIQAIFRAKEIVNYYYRKMKEEEGGRIATVYAFHVAEKSNQELKSKLLEKERERKSVAAALDNAERQAEGQQVLLRNSEDQLAISKEQIITLKKNLRKLKRPMIEQKRLGRR